MNPLISPYPGLDDPSYFSRQLELPSTMSSSVPHPTHLQVPHLQKSLSQGVPTSLSSSARLLIRSTSKETPALPISAEPESNDSWNFETLDGLLRFRAEDEDGTSEHCKAKMVENRCTDDAILELSINRRAYGWEKRLEHQNIKTAENLARDEYFTRLEKLLSYGQDEEDNSSEQQKDSADSEPDDCTDEAMSELSINRRLYGWEKRLEHGKVKTTEDHARNDGYFTRLEKLLSYGQDEEDDSSEQQKDSADSEPEPDDYTDDAMSELSIDRRSYGWEKRLEHGKVKTAEDHARNDGYFTRLEKLLSYGQDEEDDSSEYQKDSADSEPEPDDYTDDAMSELSINRRSYGWEKRLEHGKVKTAENHARDDEYFTRLEKLLSYGQDEEEE